MIVDGRTVVTTHGTAVPLSSSAPYHYGSITVTALEGNTKKVVVGGPGVVAALASRKGIPLSTGDSYTFEPGERGQGLSRESTGTIYVDAEVDGEGVSWSVQS